MSNEPQPQAMSALKERDRYLSTIPPLTQRQELALLARSLWREGYRDHIFGHITYRQDDGTLLCTPWPMTWEEVRPEDVLLIDSSGELLDGALDVPDGIRLHLELHQRRDDVVVAIHNHSRYGTIWANVGRPPQCYDQTSAMYHGQVALVPSYEGPVTDATTAGRVIEQMGEAEIALLANHGVFVLGSSIRSGHCRAAVFEHRCRMAWHVEAVGGGTPMPSEVLEALSQKPEQNAPGLWEAAVRLELRLDPTLLDAER